MCFPKSCCDDKQALLVLLIGGMCKIVPDHASEVRDKLLMSDAWASLESDCRVQSLLAFNCKSDDCSECVRVWGDNYGD